MSYQNRRYKVVEGKLKKKFEPDDNWFKTKDEAFAAWKAEHAPKVKKEAPKEEKNSKEDREAAFIEAMKSGLEPKDAAIEAGYSAGAAAMTAGRLLNKPSVVEAIAD